MPDTVTPRADRLPPAASAYRALGPFDAVSLPKGLLAEHRLKAGTWGCLTMIAGQIDVVWDDGWPDPLCPVVAGDTVVIPPQTPHHLVVGGAFRLTLTFYR